ncbi:hypothetical protein [Legionella tucsonensis]|uniref:Uncharacterized protein n=1 Tax=Legionella tucsonensis TaxID=40335 RepID=A0A0W0ZY92_9GAMM|nr:hypothetical protein [Legionella tucsonensis]KTD74079.1 hypothetical protein Ltuc_1926 [Legionella tucsonensis]
MLFCFKFNGYDYVFRKQLEELNDIFSIFPNLHANPTIDKINLFLSLSKIDLKPFSTSPVIIKAILIEAKAIYQSWKCLMKLSDALEIRNKLAFSILFLTQTMVNSRI